MTVLFEAGAVARMLEVANLAGVADRRLEEARNELEAARLDDLVRQLDKAREIHRLFAARVVALLRALQAGGAR